MPESADSSSEDGRPAPKRFKHSYMEFDEEEFVETMMQRKKTRYKCCGKTCIAKVTPTSIEKHAQLLGFLFNLNPPSIRNRVYRAFVMTCYMQRVNEKGNEQNFRIPGSGRPLCRGLWLLFMNISKSTYMNWRKSTVPKRDVLPPDHGLSGYSSNAAKPMARNSVCKFVRDVAASDGHPLPVRVHRSDGKSFAESNDDEAVVVLPPRYTMRNLHILYGEWNNEPLFDVCRSTFIDVLEKELPFVRISLRSRGLCDLCFVYRDTVRTVSDKHLVERAREWQTHLNSADITRDIYRRSQRLARNVPRNYVFTRLPFVTVSYDYAKQLTVPILSEQTMHEWFAQKKGFDVNLFGIVDEGAGDNGTQYNYLYGEGTKHGSIQVASMLDYFFRVNCPYLGTSRVINLHSDSCTGQNKNNIVLGYFMLRVAHNMHDEIIWNFMEVGHTKFRPDEGFGCIRRHVENKCNILSMSEMVEAVKESAVSSQCVLFPVNEIRNWKKCSEYFEFMAGLRKYFAYKIHIRAEYVCGQRNVLVDVYRKPGSKVPDLTKNLQKSGIGFATFESFERVPVRLLTKARREGLYKDVYCVLKENRVKMSNDAKKWWEDLIGEDVLSKKKVQ